MVCDPGPFQLYLGILKSGFAVTGDSSKKKPTTIAPPGPAAHTAAKLLSQVHPTNRPAPGSDGPTGSVETDRPCRCVCVQSAERAQR